MKSDTNAASFKSSIFITRLMLSVVKLSGGVLDREINLPFLSIYLHCHTCLRALGIVKGR